MKWLSIVALLVMGGDVAWGFGEGWSDTKLGQRVTASHDDVDFYLHFQGIRPMPRMDDGTRESRGDVIVKLQRRDGKLVEKGHTAAADYNQRSKNSVEVLDFKINGDAISGKLRVKIGPDYPRPGGPPGFPKKGDDYTIEFDGRIKMGQPAPYVPDRESHMPPWRKDTPVYGGDLITGKFKAARGETVTEGELGGARAPAEVAGQWGVDGRAHVAKKGDDVRITFSLADKRVSWGSWGTATLTFAEPITLPHRGSGAGSLIGEHAEGGIRLADRLMVGAIDCDAPVKVRFRTNRGWSEWSTRKKAGEEINFRVQLFDKPRLRGEKIEISAVQFHAASNTGIGTVGLTARGIVNLAPRTVPDTTKAEFLNPGRPSSTVTIHTDTIESINGVSEVPKGLFGHHDVHGRKPKQGKRELDPVEYMAYLNPGHLRPLDHTGFGGKWPSDEEVAERIKNRSGAEPDNIYYRRAKAANAVDNVVWTHTQDLWNRPSWMDKGVEKAAKDVEVFYRNLASRAWHPDAPDAKYNLLRRLEVWNEPFMWGRHINMGFQQPAGKKRWEDPTQPGYLPAKVGTDAYIAIFKAAAKGAHSANPHVKLGGPSAPAFSSDSWGAWDYHVRPFLDACHEDVDFITEHHYGGWPEYYAATYEAVKGYCLANFGRIIPIYNSEANHLGAKGAARADYNLRDILACIQVRDVAHGRALHALWNGYLRDPGEEHAYRFLSDLRGDVVHTSDDADLHVVATHPTEGELIVLVYNPGGTRTVTLQGLDEFEQMQARYLLSSGGGAVADVNDIEGAKLDLPDGGKTRLVEKARREVSIDAEVGLTFTLPGRSGVRLRFFKDGYAPTKMRQEIHFAADHQHFAAKTEHQPQEFHLLDREGVMKLSQALTHQGVREAGFRFVLPSGGDPETVSIRGNSRVDRDHIRIDPASRMTSVPIAEGLSAENVERLKKCLGFTLRTYGTEVRGLSLVVVTEGPLK